MRADKLATRTETEKTAFQYTRHWRRMLGVAVAASA